MPQDGSSQAPGDRRSRRTPRSVGRAGVIALYLLSPALAFIDWKWGFNVRVPEMLATHGAWLAYYGGMTLLGVLMLKLPQAASVLAVLESGINLALNAASMFLWYAGRLDAAMNTRPGSADGGSMIDAFNLPAFCVSLGLIFFCRLLAMMRDTPRRADGL